jgi:hypothetical protein
MKKVIKWFFNLIFSEELTELKKVLKETKVLKKELDAMFFNIDISANVYIKNTHQHQYSPS